MINIIVNNITVFKKFIPTWDLRTKDWAINTKIKQCSVKLKRLMT